MNTYLKIPQAEQVLIFSLILSVFLTNFPPNTKIVVLYVQLIQLLSVPFDRQSHLKTLDWNRLKLGLVHESEPIILSVLFDQYDGNFTIATSRFWYFLYDHIVRTFVINTREFLNQYFSYLFNEQVKKNMLNCYCNVLAPTINGQVIVLPLLLRYLRSTRCC